MSSDSLSIDIRLIRIGDAHVVRREGLMCGSISEVESDIRAFIASKHERVLLVRSSEKPIALVKLFVRDRHNYSASFEYILVNEIVNDTDLLTRIMDEVLHYCFIDVGLHKVSTLLTPKNIFWEPLLVSANFSQEAILKDEVKENDRFVDAGLFSFCLRIILEEMYVLFHFKGESLPYMAVRSLLRRQPSITMVIRLRMSTRGQSLTIKSFLMKVDAFSLEEVKYME